MRKQGIDIIALNDEIKELKRYAKDNSDKMDALLDYLNVTVGGDKSDGNDTTAIESVPDYFNYLKPKLASKDLATSICEFLTHNSRESYEKGTTSAQKSFKGKIIHEDFLAC